MTAYGCAKCPNRWDGLDTCHCASCHSTFTTVRVFDRHRRNGSCLPPEAVVLVPAQREYLCWTTPMRPGFVHGAKSQALSAPSEGDVTPVSLS